MDGVRFDLIARSAGTTSRRAAVRLLAGVAAGGLAGALGLAETEARKGRGGAGRGCRAGEKRCGRHCRDLRTEELHCGACFNACPAGARCMESTCFCPAGTNDVCNGACVNTNNDPNHCGGCDRICESGFCDGGVCADLPV